MRKYANSPPKNTLFGGAADSSSTAGLREMPSAFRANEKKTRPEAGFEMRTFDEGKEVR
jgi:hypothetical protein